MRPKESTVVTVLGSMGAPWVSAPPSSRSKTLPAPEIVPAPSTLWIYSPAARCPAREKTYVPSAKGAGGGGGTTVVLWLELPQAIRAAIMPKLIRRRIDLRNVIAHLRSLHAGTLLPWRAYAWPRYEPEIHVRCALRPYGRQRSTGAPVDIVSR